MAKPVWRPVLSRDFTVAARAFTVDLAGSVLLFVAASLMAGRVWRFPFDDEIYTLGRLDGHAVFANTDVHPPLSYLLFAGLDHAGASLPVMRLVSLALTALALALFHLLALALIRRRRGGIVPASRLAALLLFGLCPLAVSQGDALRWYPLFAALFALFVVLYVAAANEVARLCAAAALGLAGSANVLAAPVALGFAIYRYVLERRFDWRRDGAFWLVVLAAGSLGLYWAGGFVAGRAGQVGSQTGNGIVRAALTDALGFFGGDALGVSQAWIIIPAVVICALALYTAIDRRRPAAPVHLLLLMLATAALMIVPGFAKPRSFLYLAPVVTLFVVLWLDREMRQGRIGRALAAAALLMAANVAAIAHIDHNSRPFKRNAAIPYQAVLDFVAANAGGRVLVVSTDPVVPWLLTHGALDGCVSFFLRTRGCFAPGVHYDSIVLIYGHSDRSANTAYMRGFAEATARLVAGRQKIATMPAGRDDDAAFKTWLTGVPLDTAILTLDLYR